ncbi:MAG: Holliday junction resolvase RuvX [Rickettsiales bacterium]|nr:Holliday junction resolvase RuvX [Rickettsiales bacterium]
MIYSDFKEFVGQLPKAGKILAVDWGAKRTGIALSDAERDFAFARPQIAPDAGMVAKIAANDRAVGILVGLPSSGQVAESIKKFAADLDALTAAPILMYDETLSSVAASAMLSENGISARHQKGKLDSAAAQVLLEEFLQRIKNV